MNNLIDGASIAFIIVVAIGTVIARVLYGHSQRQDNATLNWGVLEAFVLPIASGLLARATVAFGIAIAADVNEAGRAIGWGFFLFPGVIDTFIDLFGGPYNTLTTPESLLWWATIVGTLTGVFNGFWGVYRWRTLSGWGAFLADVTWGLAGTTLGLLLHLINFAWAGHANGAFDLRKNNHRYYRGMAFKPTYALTLGAVMSNTRRPANPARGIPERDISPGLWEHENLHVWQNRLFGPFFTSTYLGWFFFTAIIGILGGWAAYRHVIGGPVNGITDVGYLSNPWEVWAYARGAQHGESARTDPLRFANAGVPRDQWELGRLVIPDAPAIALAVLFFLIVLVITGVVLANAL